MRDEMGDEIEKTLMQYCDSIEDCLEWQQHIVASAAAAA